MKKILFGIVGLMLMMGNGVYGQEMTITKGQPGEEMDVMSVENSWYVGRHGDHDCWLTRTENGPKSFVRSDDWMLVEVDRNLKAQGRLELPRTNRCEVLAVRNIGHYVSLILVDSNDARSLTLVKCEVDLDSMTLTGGKLDTIVRYEKEPQDKSYAWGAVSGNEEYVGMVLLRQMTKKRQYVAEVSLYDEALNQMWNKEYAVGTTSSVGVTDMGEVVTLGYEDVGNEAKFTINVVSNSMGESYLVTIGCDRIKDMQIVNVIGRKVLCMGLFSPRESDPREELVGGTVTMVFDLDSGNVTNFRQRPFENEDINILLNKKTKKIQRTLRAPMVMPLAVAQTPFGAVAAFGHRHVLRYMNANGTVSTSFYAQGIHLVAIDEDGNEKWVRNIRRNDMQKNTDEKMYMSLFTNGGDVCLVKNESKKYPATYDIAKEAKEYELGDKGNMVIYTVSEQGDVKKTVMEQKTKHALVSSAKRGEGEVVMLTVEGEKTRMVELKIGN